MYAIETYKNKFNSKIINILQDECSENPRDWGTNLTEMVCFHNRYNLGDHHELRHEDFNSWEEVEAHLLDTEDIIAIKPLYLYDHSGLSISTSPFSCRWDSGQIGFIFVARHTIVDHFGEIDNMEEVAENVINEELELYKAYVSGDVFCAQLIEDGEEVDFTGGFIGWDGLLENVCDAFGLNPKHFEEV